ncbi:MAG TPA: lipopolysaccharide assembly protein LapA domain-containing protein [Pseudonocardia sp.]|jgi:uncharacterized integral membrane protein|nr:lipopolysaccharide assembly protein LapA domain-containing protein [Pseudonocardia sp.]
MADEQRPGDRGPGDQTNGGPVAPGERPHVVEHENGDGHGELVPAGRTVPDTVGREPGTAGREPDTGRGKEPSGVRPMERSRVSGVWVGLTVSAVVLLFLLIFIVQNNTPTEISFLGMSGNFPVGIALLFAAAAGILLVAIPGYLRMLQLRRAVRKANEALTRASR